MQPERLAYLDITVDDIISVVCTIDSKLDETARRHFHMRGDVHVYAGDYHPAHDAVAGSRAAMQVFTDDSRTPADRPHPDHGVERNIGAVTIEADFAPVEHSDGDGGSYEAPPVEGWVAVTSTQFDALLSTLAANRASGFAPRVRLQLAGELLPGTSRIFVDIRDFVVPERRSYPVVGLELSAIYG